MLARVPGTMQQARDSSVVASLAELRAIEMQRITDERMARERAEQERRQAAEVAEHQRARDAEARVRAEHEAALALEHARLAAEREARLRVESVEAAERARQLVIVEQARVAQELEIKRAVAAKTRPTWMIAVTALATVVAGVFVWFAIQSRAATEQAYEDAQDAAALAEQAKREMEEARTAIAALDAKSRSLDAQIGAALERHAKEKDEAKKEQKRRELIALREAQAAAAAEAARLRREKLRKERLEGHKMSDECANQAVCREK